MHGERFVARVISVDDPEKAGRLKIRIYGIHDDVTQIPDDQLPWARCVFPVTSPCHQGVSGPTTGMVPNATVVGYFTDPHKQIPLVDGVIGMSDGSSSDFPRVDRGDDFNPVVNNSIWHVGTSELKFLNNKTIGSIQYTGQNITQMLTQIGDGNIASAMSFAQDAVDTMKRLKTMISNQPFDQLNSVIQGFASDLSSITGGIANNVITTAAGNIAQSIGIESSNPVTMFNNTTNLTSGLGTVTSKLNINSVEDALNRVSGNRFVMNNVMSGLDKTLNSLESVFGG